MEKLNVKSIDDDDNLLCYRHAETKNGTVDISRDHLFVFENDLKDYAATLTPATAGVVVPPKRSSRHKNLTWEDVALPYMREVYKRYKNQTATLFYDELIKKVGQPECPFELGLGRNKDVFFLKQTGKAFRLDALQDLAWKLVRSEPQ